jgi:hypothetical protein
MSKSLHRAFISILSFIVIFVLISLIYIGSSYYYTSLEERFYHADHQWLKPSGELGHGLGILGSLLMIIGVSIYMARKRFRSMARWGKLKHWLEFHIFLCTLGPIMVLFHTSFKFGGIVSISFWSMVAVFLSGIIGRFIYIQIPRTIEGRELTLNEVKGLKHDIENIIMKDYDLDDKSRKIILESTVRSIEPNHGNFMLTYLKKYFKDVRSIRQIKGILKKNKLTKKEKRDVIRLIKNEISLNRKIDRLHTMQNLFKYWHVAHLPFALVMLVIMIIHVIVTIVFGYKWIF